MATKKHILAFNAENGLAPDTVTRLEDYAATAKAAATKPAAATDQPLPQDGGFHFMPDGQAVSGRVGKKPKPTLEEVRAKQEADNKRNAELNEARRKAWQARVTKAREKREAEEQADSERPPQRTKPKATEERRGAQKQANRLRRRLQRAEEHEETRALDPETLMQREQRQREEAESRVRSEAAQRDQRITRIAKEIARLHGQINELQHSDRPKKVSDIANKTIRLEKLERQQAQLEDPEAYERVSHITHLEDEIRRVEKAIAEIPATSDSDEQEKHSATSQLSVQQGEASLKPQPNALLRKLQQRINEAQQQASQQRARAEAAKTKNRPNAAALAESATRYETTLRELEERYASQKQRADMAAAANPQAQGESQLANLQSQIAHVDGQLQQIERFIQAPEPSKKADLIRQLSTLQRQLRKLRPERQPGPEPKLEADPEARKSQSSFPAKKSPAARLKEEIDAAEQELKLAEQRVAEASDDEKKRPYLNVYKRSVDTIKEDIALKRATLAKLEKREQRRFAKRVAKELARTEEVESNAPSAPISERRIQRTVATLLEQFATPDKPASAAAILQDASTMSYLAQLMKPARVRRAKREAHGIAHNPHLAAPQPSAAPSTDSTEQARVMPDLAEPALGLTAETSNRAAAAVQTMLATVENEQPPTLRRFSNRYAKKIPVPLRPLSPEALAAVMEDTLPKAEETPHTLKHMLARAFPEHAPAHEQPLAPAKKKPKPKNAYLPTHTPLNGDAPQPVVHSVHSPDRRPTTPAEQEEALQRMLAFHRTNRARAEQGLDPLPAYQPPAVKGPQPEEEVIAPVPERKVRKKSAKVLEAENAAKDQQLAAQRNEQDRAMQAYLEARARMGGAPSGGRRRG